MYISFSTAAYILETDGIELILTITEAEVHSSPRKVSSSKSGAFSLSGKSSFSHGTLIGLLSVAIATVTRCFLQSCCFKLSWREKKMVENCNTCQLNILPNGKINIFSLLENGRDT